MFVQMGILALLAVFTGIAAEDVGGARFALAYVAFLVVQTWMWNSVRRLDTAYAISLVCIDERPMLAEIESAA